MKHIPLLFSTPMVQAVDEDRKSVTRRTRNLDLINKNPNEWIFDGLSLVKAKKECYQVAKFVHVSGKVALIKNPYGTYGDIFWVKETFMPLTIGFMYKADGLHNDKSPMVKWKSSLFMPRDAARIFLSNKGVSIDRLHDISEESAIAEGIIKYGSSFKDYEDESMFLNTAKQSYKSIWNKLNGSSSWNKNPFVWVIKFEKIANTCEQPTKL